MMLLCGACARLYVGSRRLCRNRCDPPAVSHSLPLPGAPALAAGMRVLHDRMVLCPTAIRECPGTSLERLFVAAMDGGSDLRVGRGSFGTA